MVAEKMSIFIKISGVILITFTVTVLCLWSVYQSEIKKYKNQDFADKNFIETQAIIIKSEPNIILQHYKYATLKQRTFPPLVEYKYKVKKQSYTSKKYWDYDFNLSYEEKTKTTKLPFKFSPGEKIKIFYNPDDPSDSVIIKKSLFSKDDAYREFFNKCKQWVLTACAVIFVSIFGRYTGFMGYYRMHTDD
jgi:hypothetical protein